MKKENKLEICCKKGLLSPRVSVGDLPLSFRPLTVPTETKIGRCRTEALRHDRLFGMNGNGGFTLIELLVVVLIIGILAAVAVPQYQVFVDKSRYVQAMQVVDGLVKAQQVYYLANGHFANSFDELAIAPPTSPTPQTGYKYNYPWGSCKLYGTGAGGANCNVSLGSSSVDYAVEIIPYSRRCWTGKEDSRGQRLCRSVTRSTACLNAGGECYYSFDKK